MVERVSFDRRQVVPIEQAVNRAHDLLEKAERDLGAGRIDEAGWYSRIAAVITPAYLAGDNPRSQSGYSGDDARWTHARGLIADAIDRDGKFLDVGCASGYLMETLQRWCAQKNVKIEPYGLDIAPELADLARRRLPHWADRIHVGNALDWRPPTRFDFVRTALEYVPARRRRDLVDRLLTDVVAPAGRLIIGTYNEARALLTEPTTEHLVASWGFKIAGRSERPHRDPRICMRVLWIDRDR
jgi:SAM-dependent methyltransferase